MEKELIDLDDLPGKDRENLEKLLLLAPPPDRGDIRFRRLMLFRLRLDGFSETRHYLVEKTRAADRCGFTGRLFDYLKDDIEENACRDDQS